MSIRPTARRRNALFAVPLSAVLLAGCGDGSEPAAGGGGGSGGEAAGIEGISEDLIAAAQEEGGVVIYAGGHTRPGVELLQQRMQELFDIEVTFTREDSGAVANSISAELASGSLNADVVSLTDPDTLQQWADEGVITDADIPNVDKIIDGLDNPDNPQVPYSLVPLGIMYNGATTDPADLPTTWEEFASSAQGTIVSADPGASGTALAFYTTLTGLYGEEWLQQLSERNVIVTDSSLALAQLVLTGEADIGVPAIESAVLSAAAEGEPLEIAFMEDGVPTFTSELALLADAPRPNAAKLLMQYQLSEDFQNALVEIGGRSVLDGAPQPAEGADLSKATLLPSDLEDIATRGDQVVARFAELFNR
ncbi:extracellular solute-binding protein [Blastococcus saxobsidens]|uniref:Iron(III) transport system substrate-binding protein n=1 Tax=Blastococcus saxobsidens TaxID=138336 RepID=A0A4Q7Y6Q4_9ACTN|nr:extracellular solute-binding protein [Blastococcus saxobsidens]RZU32600.1 iron(III) transport system substrate-binding protein [Blastococcus saxobsidens]